MKILPVLDAFARPAALCRACLALAFAAGPSPAQVPAAPGVGALIVPIEGQIDFKTVALVRRGLAQARSQGKGRVILEIDTPGGALDDMQEIVTMLNLLQDERVDTVAFIRRDGLSAGAIVALACDRIHMAPNARIGSATPIVLGGLRDVLEDEAYAKLISAVRADVRLVAEKHGPRVVLLAEAMVDPRLDIVKLRYKGPDGVVNSVLERREDLDSLRGPDVEILSEETVVAAGEILNLTTSQAVEFGVAEGISTDVTALLRELGVDEAETVRLETSWSEELAGFLFAIRYYLLVAGIITAVFAFKTPGTGVPEALAALCFVLFFGGSFLVGLASLTEILLFVLGVGLVLVELFVVPGTILAGLAGFFAIVASLFLSQQSFGGVGGNMETMTVTGNLWSLILVLVIVIASSVLLSKLLPHIPIFRTLLLETTSRDEESLESVATREEVLEPLLGKSGRAETDLRPAGRATIDGEPVDCVSEGAYIDAGSGIRVIRVRGNRVVVERTSGDAPPGVEAGQVGIGWLVLIVVFGLLAMVAEVFFPSFGVLSIIAAVLTVGAIFLSFQHGTAVGLTFVIVIAVTAPLVVYWALRILPKTGFGRRLILAGPTFDPSAAPVREGGLDELVGERAVSLTQLRPAGTILAQGRRLDAMTRGELVPEGAEVEIIGIEMTQLVVKRVRAGDER